MVSEGNPHAKSISGTISLIVVVWLKFKVKVNLKGTDHVLCK